MEFFDPSKWVDPSGYVVWMAVMLGILAGVTVKLAGDHWDDWLDQRWGRGSVRDPWRLDRIERNGHRR